MIHITLADAEQRAPATEWMGRSEVGYRPTMSDQELYQASRGAWVLGARANTERYALVAHGGTIHMAIEIETLEPVPNANRKAILGRILGPGHPIHDLFVEGPALATSHGNPISYHDDPAGLRLCRCGCGQSVPRGDFSSGHDQRAIHERIGRIGTVAEFLDWFDKKMPQAS